MTGRVKIIRVTTEIKEGRKEPTTEVFYECWCDVQSLGTNEKYTALQAGLENTIVFKVRNCKRMKEVRKKMKEFYAEYDGTRFDIYDASPMFTDNGWVLILLFRIDFPEIVNLLLQIVNRLVFISSDLYGCNDEFCCQ